MHISGAGTCIVVPSQAGISDYGAAPDKEHAMTIDQTTTTTVIRGGGQLI